MATKTKSKRGAPKGGQTQRLEGLDKVARIKKMRDQGKSWSEIGEAVKMTPGTAQYLVLVDSVKPSEKIKWDGEDMDALGKLIKAARDKDKLSWPVISARLVPNVTVGRVTDIYNRVKTGTKAAGERRGRKPSTNGNAKSKGKASTKAKGKSSTAKSKSKPGAKRTARRVARRVKDPS